MSVKKSIFSVRQVIAQSFDKLEKLYLFIAIPALLGIVVLTPPFHGPDEDAHFTRAYQIAYGNVLPDPSSSGIGGLLPIELSETINDSSYSPNIRGYSSQKYDPKIAIKELNDNIRQEENTKYYDTSATTTYNPISYLPAVLGILPVSVFDGPPLVALYLARIITALTTAIIFYHAIKIYPSRKIVPFLIFLTPMLLFQQSVVSVDGLSYAVLALFVSQIARLYGRRYITNKEWIILGITAVFICCLKPLVFIFVPLVILLLNSEKRNRKIILSILLVAALTIVGWFGGIKLLYDGTQAPVVATGANGEKQIELLKGKPLRVIRVAWNTYLTPYADGQTRGVIGTFGSADTNLPLWMIIFNVVVLTGGILIGRNTLKDGSRLSRRSIYLCVILAAIYFVGINASMYVAYSPVGFDIFYGVQGRYFLPVMIIIPLIVMGRNLNVSYIDANRVRNFAMYGIVFCIAFSLFTIFQRYYLFTP